jgi:hypothetical protein
MAAAETSNIVQVLQTAVSPVVLISGVGLLLLTMTNRFGRLVDRARSLAALLKNGKGGDPEPIHAQLRILSQRGRLLRRSIASAGFCVLFAALLIITLFVTKLAGIELEWLITAFFVVSLLCLILSLVDFIRDVYRALEATALEVGEDWKKPKQTKHK